MWTELIQLLSISPCVEEAKHIDVPAEVWEDFLDFLDSANTLLLTQEDVKRDPGFAKLAQLVDGILGERATPRCETRAELKGIYRVWSE